MSEQAAALPRPRSGKTTNLITLATPCLSSERKRQGGGEEKGFYAADPPPFRAHTLRHAHQPSPRDPSET